MNISATVCGVFLFAIFDSAQLFYVSFSCSVFSDQHLNVCFHLCKWQHKLKVAFVGDLDAAGAFTSLTAAATYGYAPVPHLHLHEHHG